MANLRKHFRQSMAAAEPRAAPSSSRKNLVLPHEKRAAVLPSVRRNAIA
jgi:hypothetical protein